MISRKNALVLYTFLLCFLSNKAFTQKIDTLKIIQYPSSYYEYYNALQEMEEGVEIKEPPSRTINFLVKRTEFKKVTTEPLTYVAETSLKHKVTVHFEKFDTTQHTIDYSTDKIDGKTVYGHDGIDPEFFYHGTESYWPGFVYRYPRMIEFTHNGKTFIDLPANRAFYLTCPSAGTYVTSYEVVNKGIFIISITGGDGAGSYTSLLFFKDGKYVTNYEWQYGYDWFINKFGKDYFKCNDAKGCIYNIVFP